MQFLSIGIRCLIGAVFLASAVGKTTSRRRFAGFVATLGELRLVPRALTRPVAFAVVATEFLVCVLFAAPASAVVVAGHLVAAALLAVFAAGIGLAVRRGARTPCPCFGAPSTTPLGRRHVWRNTALLVTALSGAAITPMGGTYRPGGVLVAIAAGMVLAAVVVRLDEIVDLFQSSPTTVPPGRARGHR